MRYLLALGSNLGDRSESLMYACFQLSKLGRIIVSSDVIETEPLRHPSIDTSKHQFFLNQVVLWSCILSPDDLYGNIILWENERGHDRETKWAPRHLDIDILACWLFSGVMYRANHSLCIPHSCIGDREFLKPLVQQVLVKENLYG